MGAGHSVDAGSCVAEFRNWHIPDVESAYRRALAMCPRDGENKMWINRRQFWEIFTDLTTIRNGRFLALPLYVFDKFKPVERSHHGAVASSSDTATINGIEVLLALALFCTADMHEQLRLCFRMFDVDGSNSMDLSEMVLFLGALAHAAFSVDMIASPPSDREIKKLAAGMFTVADEQGRGAIDSLSFTNWAVHHMVGKSLMENVERLRQAEAKGRGGSKEDEKAFAGAFAQQVLTQERHKRLDSRKTLITLAKQSKFGLQELKRLRCVFDKTGNARQENEILVADQLNKESFCRVITELLPAARSMTTSQLGQLFSSFDADGGGTIDFKEFSLGMSKLSNGTLEQKLQFVFEMYDTDGDGKMSISELMNVIRRGTHDMMDELRLTETVIDTLDRDNKGAISRTDFTSALLDEPLLYECFSKCLTIDGIDGDFKRAALDICGDNKRFTIKHLKSLWDKCNRSAIAAAAAAAAAAASASTSSHRIKRGEVEPVAPQSTHSEAPCHGCTTNLATFIAYAEANLGTPSEFRDLLIRLFKLVDPKDDCACWSDLFGALAQIAQGNVEDKASLYFSIFDGDASGSLSRSELMDVLMKSQSRTDNTVAELLRVIKAFDATEEGFVTFKDFSATLAARPDLLQYFETLLGTSTQVDINNSSLLNGIRQREMLEEVRTLLQPVAPTAATAFDMERRKRKMGIQRLRKLSLNTLAHTIVALQDLHADVAAESEVEVADSNQPGTYSLAAASFAAKEHCRQVSKSIQKDRQDLRRDISLEFKKQSYMASPRRRLMTTIPGMRSPFNNQPGALSPSASFSRLPTADPSVPRSLSSAASSPNMRLKSPPLTVSPSSRNVLSPASPRARSPQAPRLSALSPNGQSPVDSAASPQALRSLRSRADFSQELHSLRARSRPALGVEPEEEVFSPTLSLLTAQASSDLAKQHALLRSTSARSPLMATSPSLARLTPLPNHHVTRQKQQQAAGRL